MTRGITDSVTLDVRTSAIVAGVYLLLVLVGIRQVMRAKRVHYVGRISDAAYHAQVVEAVFPVVFLPIFVVADRWIGLWASGVLCLVGIWVTVWVDETKKNS